MAWSYPHGCLKTLVHTPDGGLEHPAIGHGHCIATIPGEPLNDES